MGGKIVVSGWKRYDTGILDSWLAAEIGGILTSHARIALLEIFYEMCSQYSLIQCDSKLRYS